MMLERICFSVLESSLVASVLYALMMLGEGRLAKYSPRCRSTLWFILSARLLVPLPVGIVYFGDSFAQAKWQLLGRVWLAGMAAFFALHLLAYYRLSRRLSRGERHLSLSHAEQQEIRRVFYEIKSTLKIAAPVQLCISSQAAGPMLLGFLRPKVVFPDCMLPKENLRMIFRHELIHYRRRDSWYRLFLLFTLSVHWFNPFLYLKGPPFCRAVCPDAAGHRKVFAGAPAPAPDAAGLLPVQQRTAAEKAADCPVFAGGSQRSPVGAVCRGADDAGDLYCIKRILLKGNSKSAGDYRL